MKLPYSQISIVAKINLICNFSYTRTMNIPDFKYENKFWKSGFELVAGTDEVGRGCFAGPVVAGCVVFPSSFKGQSFKGVKIDDSKRMTAKQREVADKWIRGNALSWGIGETTTNEINRFGIINASNKAFRKAIVQASNKLKTKDLRPIDFLLIDAFYIPFVRGIKRANQMAIIKGDQKSISIAAASIIAKVYRDKLMTRLSKKYEQYFWYKNKGYGTKAHREAIIEYGITQFHRTQFVATYLSRTNDTLSGAS